MTIRWVALGSLLVAVVAAAAGCSGDEEPDAGSTTTDGVTTTEATTTTAPERPASTTTTALDPATVEGQVEAAYLRSWDVYADAVYNLELDEEALAEVFGDPHLSTVRQEIMDRIRDGRAAHVLVEHDYQLSMPADDVALVVDSYLNHQVLIDPVSKQVIESDPNELIRDLVTLRLFDDAWKVTLVEAVP